MIAIMSEQISNRFYEKTGIKTFSLKPYLKLDTPVSSHADMLMLVLDNTVFCYEDYFLENLEIFEMLKESKNIIFVSNECKKEYPYDISLNVLIVGNNLICNKKYVAKEVINYADTHGYTVIDVKQGYSACSTLVVNESLAITSDVAIKKAIESIGKTAFLIDNSSINLPGYNCGFIGGASGAFDNKIYFFGTADYLLKNEEIASELKKQNVEIISIIPDGVYDFGGIKFI